MLSVPPPTVGTRAGPWRKTLSDQAPDLPEENSKKRTAVEVASEGALGAIPFVGSLLAASLSAYFSAT